MQLLAPAQLLVRHIREGSSFTACCEVPGTRWTVYLAVQDYGEDGAAASVEVSGAGWIEEVMVYQNHRATTPSTVLSSLRLRLKQILDIEMPRVPNGTWQRLKNARIHGHEERLRAALPKHHREKVT